MGRFISYTNCYSNHGKTIQRKSVTETDHFHYYYVPPILITIKAMVTYRGLFVLLLMLLVVVGVVYIFVFGK